MRIIRHRAADTRQALRGVRAQLGEDAVILSSRRTAEGIEVTAAVDFDATHLQGERLPLADAPPAADLSDRPTEWHSGLKDAAAPGDGAAPPGDGDAPPTSEDPACAAPHAEPDGAPAAAPDTAFDSMNEELRTLRRILETQLEQLAWADRTRRSPVVTEMLRELTEMGISAELAERIMREVPERADLASARRVALTVLSQSLPVTGPRWVEDGGRVAFIGATGVGKTITLAKIAVRWVLRHGARDLALVAADAVRIGAQDQLHSLGQLLGAAVYAPDSFSGLGELVAQLARHRLVLIDTPGASARDPQLAARLAVLAASPLESALVLNVNAQAGALAEAINRFAPANPACCLLTKVDEAASLGGSLSAVTHAQLPIAYVSEGQRVPEDLQPARALELVSAAVRLAKDTRASAGEDLLRLRFGKVTHGCA